MNRYHLLFVALTTSFVAGCATAPTAVPVAQDDKTYVTGSRLPARDGGDTSNSVTSNSSKQGIDDMMQRGSIFIPPKGGAM